MKCCENEDPAMFEVYKRIEWHCTQWIDEYSDENFMKDSIDMILYSMK